MPKVDGEASALLGVGSLLRLDDERLVVTGRRADARALARFVPDCAVLMRGLIRDPEIPRSSKLLLGGLLVYLASPVDLVPDFVPIAGQLDDALMVALVLRAVFRRSGPQKLDRKSVV